LMTLAAFRAVAQALGVEAIDGSAVRTGKVQGVAHEGFRI